MPGANFKSIWVEGKTVVLIKQTCINSNERNGIFMSGVDAHLALQDMCITNNKRYAVGIHK